MGSKIKLSQKAAETSWDRLGQAGTGIAVPVIVPSYVRVGKRKPAQNSQHRISEQRLANRMEILILFRLVQDKTL